jgi:hemerythrin-like domain-containing protein
MMRLPTTPIGGLMTEHRLIQRAVEDLRQQVARIDEETALEPERLTTIIDFFVNYADECHHGKEEGILFRRLADKSLSDEHAKMMQGLIDDHEFARQTTRKLREATRRFAEGESAEIEEIRQYLQGLVDMYPRHIETEDHAFFKPAMEYFSQEERADIEREFEQFDRSLIHQRYLRVLDELETKRVPARV